MYYLICDQKEYAYSRHASSEVILHFSMRIWVLDPVQVGKDEQLNVDSNYWFYEAVKFRTIYSFEDSSRQVGSWIRIENLEQDFDFEILNLLISSAQ